MQTHPPPKIGLNLQPFETQKVIPDTHLLPSSAKPQLKLQLARLSWSYSCQASGSSRADQILLVPQPRPKILTFKNSISCLCMVLLLKKKTKYSFPIISSLYFLPFRKLSLLQFQLGQRFHLLRQEKIIFTTLVLPSLWFVDSY